MVEAEERKCYTEFRQELKQDLGGGEDLLRDGETGKKVFGVPSGYRKENKETWWNKKEQENT